MTTPRWRIADTQLLFDDQPVLLLGGPTSGLDVLPTDGIGVVRIRLLRLP